MLRDPGRGEAALAPSSGPSSAAAAWASSSSSSSSSAAAAAKTTKRRLACAECFRLREKCIYDSDVVGEPCQRCAKLEKTCELRKPEIVAQRKAQRAARTTKRERPKACAACHRVRLKCVQTSTGTCERCAAKGKLCMPRIVMRQTTEGRDAFEDELSRVCASMSELYAYRDSPNDLARTRKAAAGIPVLVSKLRLSTAPPAWLGVVRYMMFMAKVDQSLERLHKTTAMAAAMGASEVIDALDTDAPPLPQAHMRSLARHAVERFKLDDPLAAVFYVTSNVGERTVHINQAYKLFCTRETLEAQVRDGHSPVLESWWSFMVDKAKARKVVDRATAEVMTAATCVHTPYGPLYLISTSESVLEAVDLAGAHFEVTLNLNIAVQEHGHFLLGSVRMQGLRPMDALAAHRLSELHSSATDAESLAGSARSNTPVDVKAEEGEAHPWASDTHHSDTSVVIPEGAPLPDLAMAPPPSLPPEQQAVADQLLQDMFSSS